MKREIITPLDAPEQFRVATMHRAKGLEFDEVILLLPHDVSTLKKSGQDNLQRLQYVAMTRAKRLATWVRYGC
ncbi:hypothetical protein CCP4SC76_7110001 [Gammaproteobacteria bacterium]